MKIYIFIAVAVPGIIQETSKYVRQRDMDTGT
jgi:hypothetical protein